jgi:hypothetical protein
VLVVSLATVACMGGGGRRPSVSASQPPSLSPTEAALLGQWELVGLEAQGQPRQAAGRLSFDEFNNIAVRAELAPGEAGVTPPRVVLLDFTAKASVSAPDEFTYLGLGRRVSGRDGAAGIGSRPGATALEATRCAWQENAEPVVGVMTFRRVR